MKYADFLEEAIAQTKPNTPKMILDNIAKARLLSHDCGERIEREGAVVRDLKGSIVPHPAIKIRNEQDKIVADLIAKYRKF